MTNALRAMIALAVLAVLAGCDSVGFYSQAVGGQLEILMKRRPLDKVIGDDDTPDEVRRKLELVSELVAYARDELDLPAKGQYESYSDLERDYVLWNVFAAPELSLKPRQWCYPIAGCSSYRGYFKEAAAREY
ncbi:MAG: aminopeptidase, partial [Pseudomonadales bacterium]